MKFTIKFRMIQSDSVWLQIAENYDFQEVKNCFQDFYVLENWKAFMLLE